MREIDPLCIALSSLPSYNILALQDRLLIIDIQDASPAYINCNITTNPGPSPTQPQPSSPGYLNIIQELPNTSNLDLRHEYENIGPDTANIHSPNYVPPRLKRELKC